MKITPPDINRYWRNRRYMAWTSIWCLVGITISVIAVLVLSVLLDRNVDWSGFGVVLLGLAGSFGGIIGAYIGFATSYDKQLLDKYKDNDV